MNKGTFDAITAVLSLVNPALGILAGYVGNSDAASKVLSTVGKVTDAARDAAAIVKAAAPLIDQVFGRGEELTMDDVNAAFANNDAAMVALDAEIKKQSGG